MTGNANTLMLAREYAGEYVSHMSADDKSSISDNGASGWEAFVNSDFRPDDDDRLVGLDEREFIDAVLAEIAELCEDK